MMKIDVPPEEKLNMLRSIQIESAKKLEDLKFLREMPNMTECTFKPNTIKTSRNTI